MIQTPWTRLAASVLFACLAIQCNLQNADAQNRLCPELLWKLGRLSEVATSSDGAKVIYTVRRYELAENRGHTSLLLAGPGDESESTQTLLKNWKSIADIQFSEYNDEEVVYFTGIRPAPPTDDADDGDHADDGDDAGDGDEKAETTAQVFRLTLDGKLTQVTKITDGVANLKVSPTGEHLAFSIDVKMDSTVNEIYEDLPHAEARIIDSLMYRHWNAWHDFKFAHLHVAPLADDGTAGEAVDLMPELRADCPINPFGGSEKFAWSPDGRQIALTLKLAERWAESTDSNIFLANLNDDGSLDGDLVNLTPDMPGYDNDPIYSPDGKTLAFHSMRRAGFESDRNRIMLYDREAKSISELTEGLDQNANDAVWAADSKSLFFVSEYRGCEQIFQMTIGGEAAQQITQGDFNWHIAAAPVSENRLLVTRTSMLVPAELCEMRIGTGALAVHEPLVEISHINDEIFADLEMPTVQQRWVEASDGEKIHCWVIYPPGFDPNKKYPMILYCQGGPQGQIGQWFSYRWNFHLMASHGDFVIVAPNRRGLPGFGRKWNDDISTDWGGQAMRDLLSASDAVAAEPYIDDKKISAIGASFGGYSVYWLMGNSDDRFSAMIAHCGVFDLESMYGATEELFFVNYDLGGPYWKNDDVRRDYDRFSPNRFVKNWKTPLLVIHGEKDFRVPVTQGMQAFTAAQVEGVPSRFLYFPNEGHWVMGPQNGVVWHRVFFDWLDEHGKKK